MKKWMILLMLGATVTEAQEVVPATSPASLPAGGATISLTTTRSATTLPSTLAAAGTRNQTTNPSTNATTSTAASQASLSVRSVAAAKVMPKDFALLVSRSVFVHGRMPDIQNSGNSNGAAASVPPRPETALLFNGATNADGELVAFVEDTTAGKVLKLKVGDPVARGKVAGITLDSFDYDSAGRRQRIALGQNLDGEAGTATSRPTTSASPSGSSGPLTPGGTGPMDMLERMRQKRAQELGGK